MLNIENKYKAFHISFYPHTSLTAGLNISEREKSFKEEEDAYTHLHMQMNMSTGYKPEVQTTIPSTPICEGRKNRCTYSKLSLSLCTVRSVSRQHLKPDTDHSFKNGISKNTPLPNAASSEREGALESPVWLQTSGFWCEKKKKNKPQKRRKKKKGRFFFFSPTEKAMINKRLLHFFIFCLFQNEVSLRVMP